jgi:hypothetical protein
MKHYGKSTSVILLIALSACVLGTNMLPSARAADLGATHDIRTYSNPKPLLNSVKKAMHGDKTKDGRCIWHPPPLTLGREEHAVEARQTSADYTTCTTIIEIGTPTDVDPISPDEDFGTESGTALASRSTMQTRASGRGRIAPAGLTGRAAYFTSQAYYKVTWYDIVGLELNYVRSILNWTWGNNQCILGSTQSWATFAQVGSGWTRTGLGHWKTTSCDSHYGHVDADFANSIFCIPPTYVHYRDVRIRGGYQGGYGGFVGSTWADGACLPLHWGAQLVKEY